MNQWKSLRFRGNSLDISQYSSTKFFLWGYIDKFNEFSLNLTIRDTHWFKFKVVEKRFLVCVFLSLSLLLFPFFLLTCFVFYSFLFFPFIHSLFFCLHLSQGGGAIFLFFSLLPEFAFALYSDSLCSRYMTIEGQQRSQLHRFNDCSGSSCIVYIPPVKPCWKHWRPRGIGGSHSLSRPCV